MTASNQPRTDRGSSTIVTSEMADSLPSRRPGMQLMAAVAGLVAVTAVTCLVYMGPAAPAAAPAELLVRVASNSCCGNGTAGAKREKGWGHRRTTIAKTVVQCRPALILVPNSGRLRSRLHMEGIDAHTSVCLRMISEAHRKGK